MFLKKLLLVSLIAAQTFSESHAGVVKGVTRDNATGLPIPGARVRVGNVAAVTDAHGVFALTLDDKERSNSSTYLIVEDDRYHAKQVPISNSSREDLVIDLQASKQRLIVTSDIGGADPDDEQSMVHLLVCSNEVQVEGLVCGLAWDDRPLGLGVLEGIVRDYGRVYENLNVHATGFPKPAFLASVTKAGQPIAGMKGVGTGKDSPGSELIINVLDRDDPRPVWINAWGGNNTLAQALWKVQHTRPPAEVDRLVQKLRIFDILGQDDAGAWMVTTFPHLIYIRSRAVYGWAPDDDWVANHIQNQGPLGLRYRSRIWAIEGDSPAFMHVVANGVNDPNRIDQGGWGGRFSTQRQVNVPSMDFVEKSGLNEKRFAPYEMLSDTREGVATIKRWQSAIYNDFQARMKWSTTPKFNEANHPPRAVVQGDATLQVLEVEARAGQRVVLDAAASSDPDGNPIVYSWKYYKEAGSYPQNLDLKGASGPTVRVEIPASAAGTDLHVLLEVRDEGVPALSTFRRVIVHVR